MTDLAFIHDGYIKQGIIKATKGLHPRVVFNYRPTTAYQTEMIMGKVKRTENDDASFNFMSGVIAKHLIDWDIKDHTGAPVAIDAAKMRGLQQAVFQKLFMIITGTLPSEETEEVQDIQGDSMLEYDALFDKMSKDTAEAKN